MDKLRSHDSPPASRRMRHTPLVTGDESCEQSTAYRPIDKEAAPGHHGVEAPRTSLFWSPEPAVMAGLLLPKAHDDD